MSRHDQTASFTGERVIPGQVEPDLWQEHLSRYALAARLARGRVLDAGCGCGYGTARLAETARHAVGLDRSPEALAFAREHYSAANLQFVQGDCAALPFPENHFDLLVAFEVIEHLADAEAFLRQARRVLRPRGLLLVSTPNRRYYSEERGYHNPYHTREFDAGEFEAALAPHFRHRRLLAQNRLEAIGFAEPGQGGAEFSVEAEASNGQDQPHFLLAICSRGPLPKPLSFLFLPRLGNVLRERELHIRKLETDLARFKEQTDRELAERRNWAAQLEAELLEKGEFIRRLQQEFAERNAWVQELEARVSERDARLQERQQTVEKQEAELAARAEWAHRMEARLAQAGEEIRRLQEELENRTRWAKQLDAQLAERDARVLERQQAVEKLEAELAERTEWAQRLDAQLTERTEWAQQLTAEVHALRASLENLRRSLWYRVGRSLRLSPVLEEDQPGGGEPPIKRHP